MVELTNFKEIDGIAALCGLMKESEDGRGAVLEADSRGEAHYHEELVENYFVLEGEGVLKVKDRETEELEKKELAEDMEVRIDTNQVHQIDTEEYLKVYVFMDNENSEAEYDPEDVYEAESLF